MKKLFGMILMGFALISCGGEGETPNVITESGNYFSGTVTRNSHPVEKAKIRIYDNQEKIAIKDFVLTTAIDSTLTDVKGKFSIYLANGHYVYTVTENDTLLQNATSVAVENIDVDVVITIDSSGVATVVVEEPTDDGTGETGTTIPTDDEGGDVTIPTVPGETTDPIIVAGLSDSAAKQISDADREFETEYITYSEGMVLIPSKERTFLMGIADSFYAADQNSLPAHKVTFTKNFYMDETEVTADQFIAVFNWGLTENKMDFDWYYDEGRVLTTVFVTNSDSVQTIVFDDYNNESFVNHDGTTNQLKVVGADAGIGSWALNRVGWHSAAMFCNLKSEKLGLEPVYDIDDNWSIDYSKNGYRLPTEAEWEYACRGGTDSRFFWSNDPEEVWLSGLYCRGTVGEVKTKKANPYGLYDIVGNVNEWCNDFRIEYTAESQIDPTGPDRSEAEVASWNDGLLRVIRGWGSASYDYSYQSANRNKADDLPKTGGDSGIGFRTVLPIFEN